MKVIYQLLITILLFSFNIGTANAQDPVMVIRFNQEFVDYERSLDRVVKSALDAKPTVFFDIVAIVPETPSRSDNKKIRKHSEYVTKQVVDNIQLSGVDDSKIRVTYQDSSVTNNSEVQIFVR